MVVGVSDGLAGFLGGGVERCRAVGAVLLGEGRLHGALHPGLRRQVQHVRERHSLEQLFQQERVVDVGVGDGVGRGDRGEQESG